jgi:hypothetical protein
LFRRLWPHFRAAFVLFHLACIFIVGFPAPVGGLDRSVWKLPNVQRDFEAWSRFFHVSEPVFEDFIYDLASKQIAVREVVIQPFRRYIAWTATEQPWRMFVGPVRYTNRLQIQARKQGAPAEAWETLYEERNAQYRWRESVFAPDRLRSQVSRWSWPRFSQEYADGCAYFSRLAFADFPDVADVRCRFIAHESPSPDQVRDHKEPGSVYTPALEHHRSELAKAGGAP